MSGSYNNHFYLIGYVPPTSAEGSCHKIKVKVDRHNSHVYARSQYCNTKYFPSDPLKGTKFGRQLESELDSAKPGKIGLSLQVGFFTSNTGATRVDVTLEFPWNSLKREWDMDTLFANIGVLGAIYRKDRTIAARFSDLGCCPSDVPYINRGNGPSSLNPRLDVSLIPARYETQRALDPGDYTVKVVLSDGSKFGRAEMPLTVDKYEPKQLAISSIFLCKRFRNATFAAAAAAVNLAPEYIPHISKSEEFTPTADMHFKKGEALLAYFEVYEPLLAEVPATTVQTRLKVTNIKTGELRVDTGLQNVTSEKAPGNPTLSIAEQIAVDKLSAGTYRLEVQATDSAGKGTVPRTATFMVE
jgi:hypothetical protein